MSITGVFCALIMRSSFLTCHHMSWKVSMPPLKDFDWGNSQCINRLWAINWNISVYIVSAKLLKFTHFTGYHRWVILLESVETIDQSLQSSHLMWSFWCLNDFASSNTWFWWTGLSKKKKKNTFSGSSACQTSGPGLVATRLNIKSMISFRRRWPNTDLVLGDGWSSLEPEGKKSS